jgi:hypothetical protein
VLNRVRSHISGNAVAYLALFLALGGTSYGLTSGSVDSREIRNNTIRTGDLRNNEVRSRDIRNRTIVARDLLSNTLGGDQIDERELGEIPLATRSKSADNALAVGGLQPSAFAGAPVKGTIGLENNEEGTVLTVPNLGRLYVDNDTTADCDTGAPSVGLSWQNLSATQQNLFGVGITGAATNTRAEQVAAGGDELIATLAGSGYLDALVRPSSSTTTQVRLTAFVGIGADFGDECRIVAQASVSG